jgi:hypothetical protein
MQINLVGIIENGGPPSPLLPNNNRQTIQVQYGTSLSIIIAISYRSGSPVALNISDGLILTIKQKPLYDAIITSTGTRRLDLGVGWAEFIITPAQMKPFLAGNYLYDIWLTQSGIRNPIMPTSAFLILDSITAIP